MKKFFCLVFSAAGALGAFATNCDLSADLGDGSRDGLATADVLDFSADAYRPQLKFTQRFGWANDPNGLIWWGGEYHLFHQHYPFGVGRYSPKYWNHAVSKDLVHWRELGDVLAPDAMGRMWSGSAVCDRGNTAGFGTNALVLVYTAWNDKGGRQCLAYSTDGRTFTKYAGNPVLENVNFEDRDPRVFWHEPTGRWTMALYGKENDATGAVHHVIWTYASADLKSWRKESTYFGGVPDRDNYLAECPLFEELKIEGEVGTAWIAAGASARRYSVGSFDGRVFAPQAERVEFENPSAVYAAQTFNDDPLGRRVAISWLQLPYRGEATYRHAMSLPRELSLRRTPAGLRLLQRPARELKALRSGPSVPLAAFNGELAEVVLRGGLASDTRLTLDLRGVEVKLDAARGLLAVGGERRLWSPGKTLDMTIYLDRVSAEVFANDGAYWTVFADVFPDARRGDFKVVECCGLAAASLVAYPLASMYAQPPRGCHVTGEMR